MQQVQTKFQFDFIGSALNLQPRCVVQKMSVLRKQATDNLLKPGAGMRNGFQRGQLSLVFLFAFDHQPMEFSEVLAFSELMAFGFLPDSRAHVALGNTNLVKQLIQRYSLFFLQSFLNNCSVFLIEVTQSVPLMLVTINVSNVRFAMECSLAEASVGLCCVSEKFQHSLSKLLSGKEEVGCNTEVMSGSYDLIVFFFFFPL